jgi:hypothetical protein
MVNSFESGWLSCQVSMALDGSPLAIQPSQAPIASATTNDGMNSFFVRIQTS